MTMYRLACVVLMVACVGCTSVDYYGANCIDYSARPHAVVIEDPI